MERRITAEGAGIAATWLPQREREGVGGVRGVAKKGATGDVTMTYSQEKRVATYQAGVAW